MELKGVKPYVTYGSLDEDEKRIWELKRCNYEHKFLYKYFCFDSTCWCTMGKNQMHNKRLHKSNTNIDNR